MGQEPEPGHGQADQHDQKQGGQQMPQAAFVKGGEGKTALCLLLQDQQGDQIATEHEQHVNTGKTAGKACNICIEQQNGQGGDCPQSVKFFSVLHTGSPSVGLRGIFLAVEEMLLLVQPGMTLPKIKWTC